MSGDLYVPTDSARVEHTPNGEVSWNPPGEETVAGDIPLVLYTAGTLLEVLDERIFRAESSATEPDSGGEEFTVDRAHLVQETRWGVELAATFALDCVEHVLGGAGDVELPDGATLGSVLADARRVLAKTGAAGEQRIGFLSRFAAARRLRRSGEAVGDLALEALTDDAKVAADSLDDPVWTTLAAVGDGLLAALEAVRHHVLPRYVAAREATVDEHDDETQPNGAPIVMTPWGPIAVGAEHRSPYEPAWTAARDAAARSRTAARDREGPDAEAAERAWQGERLERLLSGE